VSWGIGALAGAGLLATHWLTYRLAVPGHHVHHVLRETGHDYWPALSAVVLMLATVVSLRACSAAMRGAPRLATTARRLATVQAGAWLAVEIGERAAAGQLATVDDYPVLLVGLVVQLGVALLGALLVRLAHRALTAWAGRRRFLPPQARPASTSLPPTADVPRPLVPLAGPHGLRGPPALLPTS
jgi:hypothetical protein